MSNQMIFHFSFCSLFMNYLYILVDDEYFYTFPLLFKSFIKVQFIHVDRFTNLCLQLIEFFNHSLGYSLGYYIFGSFFRAILLAKQDVFCVRGCRRELTIHQINLLIKSPTSNFLEGNRV